MPQPQTQRGSLNLSSLIQNKAALDRYGPVSGGTGSTMSMDESGHSEIGSSVHSEVGLIGGHTSSSSGQGPHRSSKKRMGKSAVPLPTDSQHKKKRYELWEGKNKFLCGGRIMIGVHATHLIVTSSLLLVTYGIFLGLLVPLTGIALFDYLGLLLFALNMLLLYMTAFTEPGIIPRRQPSHDAESESVVDGLKDKLQFCHSCHIVRPPRAKHCRYCDNCVEVFDHHCPWTGTCIGVRNYSYFIGFIIVTVISAGFCCGVSAYVIVLWAEGVPTELVYVRDTVSPFLCSWTLVVFLLVGALLAFHLFLITRGQTTNEFLRGVKVDKASGCCSNLFRICCTPVPETKLLPMHELTTAEDHISDMNLHRSGEASDRAAAMRNSSRSVQMVNKTPEV
jgi:palmitoyltransferase ZDHHC9/14/18